MPPKSSPSSEQVVELDPATIYFTFSRIRPRFSCGRTIESTLQQFRSGELAPRDLPLLAVLTDGTNYFSQNNRRLYTYKQLRQEGLLSTVPVRLRPFPQTKRMQNKYTPETCALTATLMRDVESRATAATTAASRRSGGDGEESDQEGSPRGDAVDVDEGQENDAIAYSPSSSPPPVAGTQERREATGVDSQPGLGLSEAKNGGKEATKEKKTRQKNKKAQQQRRQQHQQRRGSSSDSDGDAGREASGVNSLEAELRKLGLQ